MTSRILPITVMAMLALTPTASAAELNSKEHIFLATLAQGDVDKAKDLAALSGIDPTTLAGQPLVTHLSNPWWQKSMPALWPDTFYTYVFKDLKQNPNALTIDGERTIFATFCNGLTERPMQDTAVLASRAVRRIAAMLAQGAKATEHKVTKAWMHEAQPLPACLRELEALPAETPDTVRGSFYNIVDLYLANGANPNYEYRFQNNMASVPLSAAVRRLDTQLLTLLVKYKADFNHAIELGKNRDPQCPRPTAIAALPEPSDKDIPRVEAFLKAYKAAGGAISGRLFSCGRKTLKDLALDRGQVEYARMLMRLDN